MTTTTKTYYDTVSVTPAEKALLEAVYKMVMEIYDGEIHSVYGFSTVLDMIMSDIIDAKETDLDGDYVVDLKEYYK
jgi:hypothetical protein